MSAKLSRRTVISGAVASVAALGINKAFAKSPPVHEIEIQSFKFNPPHVRVQIGDMIKWTNRDLAPHTATANELGWDTGELATGQSADVEVSEEMETEYFCVFHPHMKGSIQIG